MTPDINSSDEALVGSRILEEALGEVGEREPEHEAPPPAPPQQTQGGLKPMIERKRKEILDLEKRIETHRETGIYTKKSDRGDTFFDYVLMQEDNARLTRLTREYNELRERDREFATRATTQSQRAQAVARAYIDKELPKVPEKARRLTAQMFAEIFKGMLERNEWSKPMYADRAAIQSVVEQMFDTAFGSALRRSGATPGAAPAASGLDDGDDPEAPPKPEADEDDFTNNLLFAYDRRRRGSMTVAEAKRAAAAAAAEKKGASS